MSRLKVIARIVTVAAGAVAVSVASNQALADGKWGLNWLYLSVAVAVLAALYAEVFSPDPSVGPRSGGSATGGAVRGRRGVYLRQLRDSVRNMETVGVATQGEFVLGLRQVYVDVSLAPQPPHITADEPYVGLAPPGERRTLFSFLSGDDSQVFAVIGGPGSGKTTLMRSTALTLCHRGRRRRRRLPVLLYLRDHAAAVLAQDPPGLAEVAAGAGWVAGKTPASWIGRRLDKGGCLVMLDGLDEVADETDRVRVVAWIRRQIERYPRNDFLLTSRPHGYLSNPLPNANVLQVRRFTGEQISRFLHNWYYAIERRALDAPDKQVRAQATTKADDLLGRLRTRPGLYDLAANPLLLTMIANVHRYRDALPGSRAALYEEMCQVLVHRRQESKGLTNQTVLRGPQKEHIVQGLALAMMDARIRDTPAADACDAIESDLRGTSLDVSPADFLDEVRKSGLLVEREQGRYAFAHLTLQEYLAAAQIGHQSPNRLTEGVDDPWWRETTLLWAANADATSVIDTCLKSGTVRALALAFDCADEARTLAPSVRRELDDLLAPQSDGDPDRQRLITGVKAARSLREVIWLNEDTTICARPVTRDLYSAFTQDEQASGRHMPTNTSAGKISVDADNAAATGMWASDAVRFVSWLNSLFDDGTTYRLPTPTELEDPAIGLVIDLARYTIWAQTEAGPRLHQPSGAIWPYTPNPARLGRYVAADRAQAFPYLALTPPGSPDVRAFMRVFSVALTRTPQSSETPYLSLLNLALARDLTRAITLSIARAPALAPTLDRILTLDRVLTLDRALDLDLDLGLALARVFALGLDHDRAIALTRALNRALDLARTGTLALALDLARILALARILDHDHDHDRAPARDHDLARDLAHALDLALAHALDRARTPDSALGRALAHDSALAHALDRTLDCAHALDRTLGLEYDLSFDLALALARDLDRARARDRARDPALARDLDCALARARDRARDPALARDLDRALARALDLAPFVPEIEQLQNVVDAFRILFELWTPPRSRRLKPGEALAAFDAYLTGIAAKTSELPIHELPVVLLQQASDMLATPPRPTDHNRESRDQARLLLDHARTLVIPILDRTAPYDSPTLSYARIELLATAALLLQAQDQDAATLIIEAVRGLVALQEREEGHLIPNEVLLLVRA